jgi:hypothetical protein
MSATGFNLTVYDDAGCVPGTVLTAVSVTNFQEVSVGCQAGVYPMFRYEADILGYAYGGEICWFGVQMMDHVFPPQFGRLAAAAVTNCDSVFKGAIFSFPDWTPAIDIFGVPYDASQELVCWWIPPPDPQGACCLPDGGCQIAYPDYCQGQGGVYKGDHTTCSPQNPCDPTSDVSDRPGAETRSTTWGRIKGDYR